MCSLVQPWSVPDTFCCVRCTALGVRPRFRPEGEPLAYCVIPASSTPSSTRSLTIDVPARDASPRLLDFRIFPASALGDFRPLTTARVLDGARVRIEYTSSGQTRVLFDTNSVHPAEQAQMLVLDDAMPRCEFRITIEPRAGEAGYFCVPWVVHDRWNTRKLTRDDMRNIVFQIAGNPRPVEEETRLFEQTLRGSCEGDDEVEIEGGLVFDLNCPIGQKKMRMPIRSRLCKHLSCFDMAAHVQLLVGMMAPFACPLCGVRASPELLMSVPWVRTLIERTGPQTTSYAIEQNATLADFKWAGNHAKQSSSNARKVAKQ